MQIDVSTVNYLLFSCSIYIYIYIFCKYVIQNKNQAWYFFRNIYSYYQTLWISTFADIYFHKLTDVFFFVGILLLYLGKIGEYIYIYMYTYQSTGTVFFFSHYVDIGIDVTRFTRSNTNMRIDIIILYSCHSTYTSRLWSFFLITVHYMFNKTYNIHYM